MYKLSLFFVFLCLFTKGYSTSLTKTDTLDKVIIEDLSNKWLYYDYDQKCLLPYFFENKNSNSIQQWFNLNKNIDHNLNFIAKPGTSLLINQKLYYKNISDQEENIKINLSDLGLQEKECLITLYNKKRVFSETFFIGSESYFHVENKKNEDAKWRLRASSLDTNSYLMIFFVVLIILTVFKNSYPRGFKEFINFRSFFSIGSEDSLLLDLVSVQFFALFVINVLSLYFVFLMTGSELPTVLLENNSLKIILLIAIALFVKFIYLSFTGWIYKISHLVKMQYLEFIKLFTLYNILFLFFAVFSKLSKILSFQISYIHFLYGFLLVMLILIFKIGFFIFRNSSFRKFYLISYLCIAEILPLFVIIKILINNKIF